MPFSGLVFWSSVTGEFEAMEDVMVGSSKLKSVFCEDTLR